MRRKVGGAVLACVLGAAALFGCASNQQEWGEGELERVDHDALADVLREHVDEQGRVDYEALERDEPLLDAYLEQLARADLGSMSESERLATMLNAYNAFTLKLMLDYPEAEAIHDIPELRRWEDERWVLGGRAVSLNELEHDLIRPSTGDARVHFALVCASEGCPPLTRDAYDGDRLAAQLEAQAELVHTEGRWFRYDEQANEVWLSPIYRWYGEDFNKDSGSVLAFVSRYSPEVREAVESGDPPRVRWLSWDWSLNAQGAHR